jgi:hypothetical protein
VSTHSCWQKPHISSSLSLSGGKIIFYRFYPYGVVGKSWFCIFVASVTILVDKSGFTICGLYIKILVGSILSLQAQIHV